MSENNGEHERRDLTKKDKVNRFLYRCGVLWQDKKVEDSPDIDTILERLQDDVTYDIVTAVVKTEQYGIDRKLDAINYALDVDIEDMPKIRRRMMDKISHDATVNIWDYILRVARREDWKVYTFEGYEELSD